jgi:hypothetical protein
MSLTITDQVMRSTDTPHIAECVYRGPAGNTEWRVSWLPGKPLDYNRAVTAMTIAEAAGKIPADAGPDAYSAAFWTLMDSLAGELGLSGATAVTQASETAGS